MPTHSSASPVLPGCPDLPHFWPINRGLITRAVNLGFLLSLCTGGAAQVATKPVTPSTLLISQVYVAGGNAGAVFRNDFVELYNRGNTPVSLAGWSLQYASANGSFGGQMTRLPSAVIAPGTYFLVQEGSGGSTGAMLPTPEAIGSLALSASAGKLALVRDSAALSGVCPNSLNIADLIGYGAVNCAHGTPARAPGNATAMLRQGDGRVDTGNNFMDFMLAPPKPRNGTVGKAAPVAPSTLVISQIYVAGGNPGAVISHDYVELYNRGTTPVSLAGWSLQYASANGSFGGEMTRLPSVVVAPGTYLLVQEASGGSFGTPLLNPGAIGTINLSASAGKLALVRDSTPLSGICPSSPNIADLVGYGTANCAHGAPAHAPSTATAMMRQGDGKVDTSNNVSDFVLAPPKPRGGTAAKATPAVPGTLVISQIYVAGGIPGAVFRNDYVQLFNPGSTSVSLAGWSLQYASANGIFGGQITRLPGVVVAPGGYFLVQEASGGPFGATLLNPGATGTIDLSASAGKLALVRDSTPLSGACPNGLNIADLVGYGATGCARGTPAHAPSNVAAMMRQGDGRVNTNNNVTDFMTAPARPHY